MSHDLSPAMTPQPPHNPGKQPRRQPPAPDADRADSDARADPTAKQEEEERRREQDKKLDQALKDTFPASDPFSIQ